MSTVVSCPSCQTKSRVPASATGRPRCPECKKDLPWIAAATDTDFDAVADSSRMPVLVDLWADWCGPCRTVSPLLEQLATERAGRLKLVKVDVEKSPRTQARFRASSIPMLVLMRDGEVVAQQAGAMPLPALRKWVDSGLAGS